MRWSPLGKLLAVCGKPITFVIKSVLGELREWVEHHFPGSTSSNLIKKSCCAYFLEPALSLITTNEQQFTVTKWEASNF